MVGTDKKAAERKALSNLYKVEWNEPEYDSVTVDEITEIDEDGEEVDDDPGSV